MKRHRFVIALAVGLVTVTAANGNIAAQAETLRLTIASSHATTLPWVGVMHSHVVPESNRRLEAMGSTYRIKWTEAYGGSLYKYQNTLEAVEIGLTDIGWVGAVWEASKLPLQNVTYNNPFVTDDLPALLELFNELHDRMPALAKAWTDHNQMLLGASGVETYHLMTNFPVRRLDDLKGRKILAPGPSSTWLRGTGAVSVNGGLTTYYTQIRTGVADGVLTIVTGAYPYKLHEVAPFITLVNIGAQFNGGMAINLDTWKSLPREVQEILHQLGREYSRVMAREVMERYDLALEGMAREGATITTLAEAERAKWINGLPDLGSAWVAANERRGLPAAAVLAAFMDGVRARGGTPSRDWDRPSPRN